MSVALQLSPSALAIFNILLTKQERMKKKEILAKTQCSPRSFYYAVRQLREQNLIQVIPDVKDMRRAYYSVT